MNKPYHERPDWILKSIVYFCDNYTINGEALSKEKTVAIKTYKNGVGPLTRISNTINMSRPPSWDFWECLAWLHGYMDTGKFLT
jgi:hypothetical protein